MLPQRASVCGKIRNQGLKLETVLFISGINRDLCIVIHKMHNKPEMFLFFGSPKSITTEIVH